MYRPVSRSKTRGSRAESPTHRLGFSYFRTKMATMLAVTPAVKAMHTQR